MSKYEKLISAIFLLILAFTIWNFFYFRSSLNTINSRVNTLNSNLVKLKTKNNVSDDYIFKEQFKEDYYISQLDREMNLVLFAMGVLFAAFGIITYINFEGRLKSFKEGNQKLHQKNEQKYQDLRRDTLDLNAELNEDISIVFSSLSMFGIVTKNKEFLTACEFNAIKYDAKAAIWFKENNDEKKLDRSINNLNELLDSFINEIENDNLSSKLSFTFLKRIEDYLDKLGNRELSEKFYKIIQLYNKNK